MANYKIHDIPFTKLYLTTNGVTNPNLDPLNNNVFKGLGTNFVSSTYLIERPFQNFLYLNNGADISPYFFANISDYDTPGTFLTLPTLATPNVNYKHANFMIIGGGGGGGAGGGGSDTDNNNDKGNVGSPGGHGQFQVITCYPLLGINNLSIIVGAGGNLGEGRKKDPGLPGGDGGPSSIIMNYNPTLSFTSFGGTYGKGGGQAGTGADAGLNDPARNAVNINFTLYNNYPTNPLMIYPAPPAVIGVNSVLSSPNIYASSAPTGNAGSAGLGNRNNGDYNIPQDTANSFGQSGTAGTAGRVVIFWLYDSRQRILKPTIWVDAYSGGTTSINYGKTSWDSGLTISGSGLSGYFTNGSSSNTMSPPMVFAYVIVYTFQTYSQYMSFFQTLSNTNYLFLNNGTEFDAEFDAFGGASGYQLNRTYTYYVNGVNTRRTTRTQNNRQIVVVTLDSAADFTAFPNNIVKIQNDGFLAFSGNKIHEFMLFDYDINATNVNGLSSRQYIEGHLASKWNITLPTYHPFYGKSNIMYFE